MEGERHEYKEIMDKVWQATDPELGPDAFVTLLAGGEAPAVAIWYARSALGVFEGCFDEDRMPAEHARRFKEEAGETIRKMRKNIGRMVSDYARYIDKLQDCTCETCRAGAAKWN